MENKNEEKHISQAQGTDEKESQKPISEIGKKEYGIQAQKTDKKGCKGHKQDIDDEKIKNRNQRKTTISIILKAIWKWFLGALDVFYKLAGIIAVIGVFIAWYSLYTTLHPQDIPGNQKLC